MNNYISFANILRDRDQFRKSGTKSGSEFNLFDVPGHKYFKLFFYFNNGDVGGNYSAGTNNGLLAPTWLLSGIDDTNYYMFNSAWSYLKMNNEDERAEMLVDFVNLLSNISSESPWYFSEITGLDSALDRKNIGAEYFNIEQTRPKLSIKCLQDAYDDRIGTLLDLYRAIVWSWTTKRQVLPDNLKKFDMGILIFDTPNSPFHKEDNFLIDDYEQMSDDNTSKTKYTTSYKYIELHNCEIDYNSSKALYASLNNKEGVAPEYTIDIHFDDCFETRYNEFSLKKFGDIVTYDILSGQSASNYNYKSPKTDDSELYSRINAFDKGFLGNMIGQLVSTGIGKVTSLIQKALLGNLYKFSLTKIGSQLKGLVQGNVLGAVGHIKDYLNDNKQTGLSSKLNGDSKLFKEPTKTESPSEIGNISTKKLIKPKVRYIGNLYKGNTIADNL